MGPQLVCRVACSRKIHGAHEEGGRRPRRRLGVGTDTTVLLAGDLMSDA